MVGGDERIVDAHDQAVGRTLAWIEETVLVVDDSSLRSSEQLRELKRLHRRSNCCRDMNALPQPSASVTKKAPDEAIWTTEQMSTNMSSV